MTRYTIAIGTATVLASVGASGLAVRAQDKPPRARVAITRTLPKLDGARLEASVVEVTYEPGGSNTPHRHPCPVIGYVLEGSVRMQLKGQPERIYNAGDTFYETPGDVHQMSANASKEKPATFLAYFVCDHPGPRSIPVTGGKEGR